MKPVWGPINDHDRQVVDIHLFSDCAASMCAGYVSNDRVEGIYRQLCQVNGGGAGTSSGSGGH